MIKCKVCGWKFEGDDDFYNYHEFIAHVDKFHREEAMEAGRNMLYEVCG